MKSEESQANSVVKCSTFCNKFYDTKIHSNEEYKCIPSYYTLRKWFYEFHKNKVFPSQNQGGRRDNHIKLTPEVITCLICTLLDFPTWTLSQRTSYINGQNGATDKNIKISTIGKACKFLNFSVHKTRYSPPARNSIGLRALRICWSKYVSQIIQNRSSCFVFIDEAGLSFVPRNSMCRGFVGITPLTLRDLQFARISIVAAVIPGYGVIYQWSNGKSVKSPQYCSFLKQVANIVRRFIGNGRTQITLIHDNASIHWTNEVKEVINNERFELIPTVPYSPQLNYLVECYFGLMKEHISLIDIPPVVDEEIVEMVKYQWDVSTRNHYNGETTSKVFSEWTEILEDCMKGVPLGHEGHHKEIVDHTEYLRGFETYRYSIHE